MSPSVSGVLQVMKLNEHRVARGVAGFWAEQKKLIHVSCNEIPFTLSNGEHSVEIIDALSSEILDLDVVYDNYEPTSLSFFDHIFGFFSGIRQKGVQTTEEILREGSFVTAVGELELDGNHLRLQPSNELKLPMFLTTATKNTLLKRMEEAKLTMMAKIFICSSIASILVGIIGRRYYLRRKQERDERRLKESLEKSRQQRRAQIRSRDHLAEDQRCVVCLLNPKEVIVLPCGHVCLCEECAIKIKAQCPICRARIETKAAAFIT
jgi:E3 ubiquitin-protein ligase MUL1